MRLPLLTAVALLVGACEAIDDFSAFHVIAGDGGRQQDAATTDLAMPDSAPTDLTTHCSMNMDTAPPPSGLVAYWSFDEGGSSFTPHDYSGNHNDGHLVRGAVKVPGKVGLAYQFSRASATCVAVPKSPSLDMQGNRALTMMSWVNYDGGCSVPCMPGSCLWAHIIARGNEYYDGVQCGSNPIHQEGIVTQPGEGLLEGLWWAGGKTQENGQGQPLSLNQWHHVATTWDGSTVREYVDGVEVSSRMFAGAAGGFAPNTTFAADPQGLGIGCTGVAVDGSITSGNNNFSGILDEVALYNRALTACEIESYYAATNPSPLPCVATLANVGAGDFTIAFKVTIANPGQSATLLTQRSSCDNSVPFWYVGMKPSGGVYAETGSGAGYTGLNSKSSVNDGQPHRTAVQRRGGILFLVIDGKLEDAAASPAMLDGTLPPLEIGKSMACNVATMPGVTIDTVCLTIP